MTFSTNATMDFFAAPSFQDGSGSGDGCAAAETAHSARTAAREYVRAFISDDPLRGNAAGREVRPAAMVQDRMDGPQWASFIFAKTSSMLKLAAFCRCG